MKHSVSSCSLSRAGRWFLNQVHFNYDSSVSWSWKLGGHPFLNGYTKVSLPCLYRKSHFSSPSAIVDILRNFLRFIISIENLSPHRPNLTSPHETQLSADARYWDNLTGCQKAQSEAAHLLAVRGQRCFRDFYLSKMSISIRGSLCAKNEASFATYCLKPTQPSGASQTWKKFLAFSKAVLISPFCLSNRKKVFEEKAPKDSSQNHMH